MQRQFTYIIPHQYLQIVYLQYTSSLCSDSLHTVYLINIYRQFTYSIPHHYVAIVYLHYTSSIFTDSLPTLYLINIYRQFTYSIPHHYVAIVYLQYTSSIFTDSLPTLYLINIYRQFTYIIPHQYLQIVYLQYNSSICSDSLPTLYLINIYRQFTYTIPHQYLQIINYSIPHHYVAIVYLHYTSSIFTDSLPTLYLINIYRQFTYSITHQYVDIRIRISYKCIIIVCRDSLHTLYLINPSSYFLQPPCTLHSYVTLSTPSLCLVSMSTSHWLQPITDGHSHNLASFSLCFHDTLSLPHSKHAVGVRPFLQKNIYMICVFLAFIYSLSIFSLHAIDLKTHCPQKQHYNKPQQHILGALQSVNTLITTHVYGLGYQQSSYVHAIIVFVYLY